MTSEITVSKGFWTTVQTKRIGDMSTVSTLPDDYVDELVKRGFSRSKPVTKNGRIITIWKKMGSQ